jgi:catechol 2,3-dioxygenase-like lactoylglutathione lyase family enzyme
MFDHVTIRVSERGESRRFYETVLGALERERSATDASFDEWNDFSLTQADAAHPVTRRLHIGFGARSRDEVDAFWRAGTEAGFTSDGEPGLRAIYHADYYGAFLLDPDGNSAEAVYHGVPRTGEGYIDHLTIRVAEIAASKRFYRAIAPSIGVILRGESEGRFVVSKGNRAVVFHHGEAPTEHVHIAFRADGNEAVHAFHEAALAAGARDNGEPGERDYHPGYYAAFALDPDGNNIEAVEHHWSTG